VVSTYPEIINLIGRVLLVSYFLKAAMNNSMKPQPIIGMIKSKNFPLPQMLFISVLFIQVLGSLSVIFNLYPIFGALSLITFTVLSNMFFCDYWKMDGLKAVLTKHLFSANIAIIGGLILVLFTPK